MSTPHFGAFNDSEVLTLKEIMRRLGVKKDCVYRTLRKLGLEPIPAFGNQWLSGYQIRLAIEGFSGGEADDGEETDTRGGPEAE